jgi:CrcB protein
LRLLLICLGGACGTAARYGVEVAAARWLGVDFPYGTLIVNVLGSFLIGVIQEVALSTSLVSETLRLVLAVGVMGGFTTYSAFSYGTLRLVERGTTTAAAVNVLLTTGLCLGACVLGLLLGRALVAPR